MASISPDLKRILDSMAPMNVDGLTREQAVARLRQPAAPAPSHAPARRTEDTSVRSGGYSVPVRVYHPSRQATGQLVYLHGGGWVMGSFEHDDYQCSQLAAAADCVVISPNYRLAPEFPYPKPLEDCIAVARWAIERAGNLGLQPDRCAVGGTSAGANLAAACALKFRAEGGPQFCRQILVYPITDADFDTPSYIAYGAGYHVSSQMMRWFWDCYAPPELRSDPLVSPLRASSLAGLPPALVITAELDPLRDEGEHYADRLRQAGVGVTLKRFEGMVHGFLKLGPDEAWARAALALCAAELRQAFSPG